MEYRCNTEGTEVTLLCATQKEGFSTDIDGAPYAVLATPVDERRIHLLINGRSLLAHVEAIDGGKCVTIGGVPVTILDADRTDFASTAPDEMPGEVTPPMPSVVVALLVSPGETVAKGTPLVTLSAMKMETTLTAPFDATVASVNTTPGTQVMPGEILVSLDARVANDPSLRSTG